MNLTKIEWTDFTANPVRYRAADGRVVWACEKLSAGCANCYAESLSHRYGGVRRAGVWTAATLTPFLDEKELRGMLTSKSIAGKRVFIGDMTDVCGEWVSDEILDRLFAAMVMRPDVTWQLLTKRPGRLAAYLSAPFWANRILSAMKLVAPKAGVWSWPSVASVQKHIHLGFSAENQPTFDERWPHMAQVAALDWTTFCSAEPLLGAIDANAALPKLLQFLVHGKPAGDPTDARNIVNALARVAGTPEIPFDSLRWVIVGGESGHGARACEATWIRLIVRQCRAAGVPVFVKQMGRDPRDIVMRAGDEWPGGSELLSADGAGLVRPRLKSSKGGDMAEWPEDLRVRQFPAVRS